jgi:hypothetical protein
LFYQQVSSNSTQMLDDMVPEVAPGTATSAAQWEDTSSCSEGREDTSPSSPEPVSAASGKLSLIKLSSVYSMPLERNVWFLYYGDY